MKKLYVLVLLMCLMSIESFAQSKVKWNDVVMINENVQLDLLKNKDDKFGNKARYGSQYARLLKLDSRWLVAYTVSRNLGYNNEPHGGYQLEVAESYDDGKSWTPISIVTDPGRDLDNAMLIQLPNGDLLMGCRSVRWQESYRLPVYRSSDNGYTWTKVSTIDENEGKPGELGTPDKGVYEPHFEFLKDGSLSVMYANEIHVSEKEPYSQILSQKISSDLGKSWGEELWVAYEKGNYALRPGMPVWTKMTNGKYIMVYEICGPLACNVYYKISSDGKSWPEGIGTAIPEQNGGPYILSLSDGRLIVTSNAGNISISDDFGSNWHTTSRPWEHKKPFSEDWTQTVWSSMYEVGDNEIVILTTIQREIGGHNIQMRFGTVE